jgi:hypothetical protein
MCDTGSMSRPLAPAEAALPEEDAEFASDPLLGTEIAGPLSERRAKEGSPSVAAEEGAGGGCPMPAGDEGLDDAGEGALGKAAAISAAPPDTAADALCDTVDAHDRCLLLPVVLLDPPVVVVEAEVRASAAAVAAASSGGNNDMDCAAAAARAAVADGPPRATLGVDRVAQGIVGATIGAGATAGGAPRLPPALLELVVEGGATAEEDEEASALPHG